MNSVFHSALVACIGLVWSTFAWSAEVGICSENFPDGLQSYDRGRIDFGYNAQLQNSPDARLHASTITRNWWSWFAPTCTTSQCEAINANGPSQSPGGFKIYPSTTDFNVGYQENRTLSGNGLNRYRTVDVGTDAQLTINSSEQSFYVAQLRVGYRGVLRLSPGDYWVGSLETGSDSQIQVVGNGRVRLFVRDAPNLGYRSLYNSPGNETAGSASKLLLYGYNGVTINTATTFSGYVYSQSDVVIGDSVRLYGAVTAANISLSSNAAVRYVAPVGSCSKPAELRLSWLLDEASWTGVAGEVKDASGNGLVGRAINGATTASATPALPEVDSQGTCGYGSFDGSSNQYLQAAHDDLLTLRDSFTIGVWVRPRSLPASGLMSILSKDENYEFHLNSNGTVNWWWQTTGPTATVQFNSNKALAVGQWNHVLVRYTPGDQRIFINGVEAGRASFAGTPVSNTDPLQLGWDQLTGRDFNGELDELRIYDGALSDSEIAALVGERHACSRRLQCFGDNFDGGMSTDWAVSSRGRTVFTPAVYSGRLRLTSNANNVSTASALQRLFPAQGNFIQVEFDYYAYNGSGADGIAVILSDAAQTPQPGGFGGSLGYAQLNDNSNKVNGFSGGWLGIAVDEYGNFSNPTEGRIGGSGLIRDSVSVRGSGNGLAGYRYLRGTERILSPEVDAASSRSPSPGHRYRLTIDARVPGQVLVTVERKTGSSFEVLPNLDRYNVMASGNSQAALPERFYLSLTGSTGGSSNIHEIDNLNICATDIEPIGEQIHHFDLRYSSPSLTCNPQEVTVTACLNADCSQVYSEAVTATLAADGAVWQGGNQLSFTGGTAKAMVQVTRPGEATIGVGGSTPPALSFGETTCSTVGCKLVGVESGFIVDVPTLIANRPQSNVWLRAVKADAEDPQKCVAGFGGGTKSIGFNATYDSPSTGSRAVIINGASIRTTPTDSATEFTPLTLKFDAEATAPLTVSYSDAGRMNLNVRYAPTEGYERGLVMLAADQFVSKPYGIHIETDIDEREVDERCNGLTIDECPMFIAAGEPFPVRFRAVGWGGSDSELRTAQALADNITTPNFALSAASGAFRLEQTLMAPADGDPGALGAPSYDHLLGEISTVTAQSISEVGIFQLTASPHQSITYFGETVDGGVSNLIGRFIPARLGITATASLTPSCSVYSYQGQPMDFAPGLEPRVTVIGYNSAGSVTKNYDRGPFWRLGSPAREAYHSIVGKVALDERLITRGSPEEVVEGASDGDGSRVYRWSGEQLVYEPGTAPSLDDLPFVAVLDQTLTAASLTDLDGACHSSAGSGCQSYTYEFNQSPGSEVRLGRLSLGNAHGSELQGLDLPVAIETWQPLGAAAGFRPENDQCTVSATVGEPSLQAFSGDLSQGDTAVTVNILDGGKGTLGLSAPGQGNQGGVKVALPLMPEWLKYDWTGKGRESAAGLASFGIYRGPPPLIFRREVYR
jgi:MSHA biogenesis protein MshQ